MNARFEIRSVWSTQQASLSRLANLFSEGVLRLGYQGFGDMGEYIYLYINVLLFITTSDIL